VVLHRLVWNWTHIDAHAFTYTQTVSEKLSPPRMTWVLARSGVSLHAHTHAHTHTQICTYMDTIRSRLSAPSLRILLGAAF
jgi:hypothetical protein